MRSGEQVLLAPDDAAAHIKAGLASSGPIILEK
jgi:hypothetical protein